jgi:hypothetical protein
MQLHNNAQVQPDVYAARHLNLLSSSIAQAQYTIKHINNTACAQQPLHTYN